MTSSAADFAESTLPLFDVAARSEKPVVDIPPRADRSQRLQIRFRDHGADTLADDELLELVLARALPWGDVTVMTRALLARFGDFSGVVSAPARRLLDVPGIDAAVVTELKVVEASAQRLARAQVMHRSVISSWDALLTYCRTTMAHRDNEHFRVLFLDRQNTLIADEEQARGTVNHVPVYPREVAKRALELNASALILVHNHPSGDATPSESDISMTARVQAALDALDITLHDHLVIGRGAEVSFREAGLL